MTVTETKRPPVNVATLSKDNVLSESSHYKVIESKGMSVKMLHLESNSEVTLSNDYVRGILASADQFDTEELVGREDKLWTANQIAKLDFTGLTPRLGDMKQRGIRSIFEQIYTSEVFTVCFTKQDKPLSQKKYNELLVEQVATAVTAIEKARDNKTGVANEAESQIMNIINNPVLPYEPGEERILRGFKVQFTSRDGRYDCIDMDLEVKEGESNLRPVNINAIKWLIFRGVKYIVEK